MTPTEFNKIKMTLDTVRAINETHKVIEYSTVKSKKEVETWVENTFKDLIDYTENILEIYEEVEVVLPVSGIYNTGNLDENPSLNLSILDQDYQDELDNGLHVEDDEES